MGNRQQRWYVSSGSTFIRTLTMKFPENEIYVWDRATGHMLHTLRSTQIQEFSSSLNVYDIATFTCRVVQGNTTGMLLASASRSGGVIIWQSPPERESQSPLPDSSASPQEVVASESNAVANRPSL